ncbi:MAG: hypothetical protein PHU12_03815 [Candidatus Aenigmarchaeota archaeon]|nr:hypothetical protein [Candidatus Aenigmarchaeota archaeon]
MKKLMIILGGGGHTAQLLKLVNMLGNNYSYEYVVEQNDKLSPKKIKIRGKILRFKKTRNIKEFIGFSLAKQFVACVPAMRMMKKSEADTIITCGPNFSIPLIVSGKMCNKKIIFIETWSRIYRKSLSGRFAYKIADKFFVQWPEMKKLYPKAIYAGRFA